MREGDCPRASFAAALLSPFGTRVERAFVIKLVGDDGDEVCIAGEFRCRLNQGEWGPASEESLRKKLEDVWEQRRGWLIQLPQHALFKASGTGCEEDHWRVLTRLVETAWGVVQGNAAGGDVDAARRLPGFERLRYLLLTTPYRRGGDWGLRVPVFWRPPCGNPPLCELVLAARAWEAREAWADRLLAGWDHPWLADHWALEREMDTVLWDDHRRHVNLAPRRENGVPGALSNAHVRTAVRLAREFYLRRFSPLSAALIWRRLWVKPHARSGSSAASSERSRLRSALPYLPALLLGAVIVMVLLSGLGLGLQNAATYTAAATYALVALSVVLAGNAVVYPLCLRLAAGSSLGIFGLLLGPGRWVDLHQWWRAGLFLIIATVVYLIIESRAAVTSSWGGLAVDAPDPSISRKARCVFAGRVSQVAFLGVGHSVAVAAIALRWMAPSVSEVPRGSTIAATFGDPARFAQGTLFVASVGLALGVFLQILWEEQPVTYPLIH